MDVATPGCWNPVGGTGKVPKEGGWWAIPGQKGILVGKDWAKSRQAICWKVNWCCRQRAIGCCPWSKQGVMLKKAGGNQEAVHWALYPWRGSECAHRATRTPTVAAESGQVIKRQVETTAGVLPAGCEMWDVSLGPGIRHSSNVGITTTTRSPKRGLPKLRLWPFITRSNVPLSPQIATADWAVWPSHCGAVCHWT